MNPVGAPPDPRTTLGRVPCNEPLRDQAGKVVAYCCIWVKAETPKRPRGTHRERHRVEWR